MSIILFMLGTLAAVACFYATRYVKVGPNEVLIVSGRKGTYVDPRSGQKVTRNFRIYHGGGTFVWPVREKVDRMSVELMTLEIRTPEFFTKFGVPIVVDGIAQIKVRSDDPIPTATAVEMFLSKSRDEMNETAHQMMQGHLRAVISTMPFEEIHANPEVFAQTVQRLTAEDLANMGIQVVSFTIREVQDPSGYLNKLGRSQLAAVEKDAVLGEANASRDSTKGKAMAEREATVSAAKNREEAQLAEIEADLAVANSEKDKEVRLHALNGQASQAKASSDIAYDLQKAKMQQLVVEEELGVNRVQREKQIEIEELEIERKTKELRHAVERPAEAEQRRIETLANAELYKRQKQAEADARAARLQGEAEADIIRAKGAAEADAIRDRAMAEAEGVKARCLAEAEGMKERAAAWKEYNSAAVAQLVVDKLPEIAGAVAAPLDRIDRIVMVNNGSADGTGVEKVTKGVTDVMAQLPGMVEMMTGVDLGQLLSQVPGLSNCGPNGSASQDGPGSAPDTSDSSPEPCEGAATCPEQGAVVESE